MFDIHNYDKEEYEKERQDRLRKEERVEEQKKPHNQERDEDENQFDYYKKDNPKSNNSKRSLLSLALLGTVGVIGYLGFNYGGGSSLKEPQREINSTTVEQSKEREIHDEANKTITLDSPKSEKEKENLVDISNKEIESISTTTPIVSKEKSPDVTDSNREEKKTEIDSVKTTAVNSLASTPNITAPTPTSAKTIIVKNESTPTPTPTPKKEKIEVKKKVITPKPKVVKKEKREVTVERKKRRVVTVKKGDTLASISKRFYGNSMKFDKIIRANRRIRSQSTSLRLGEKLWIPRLNRSKEKRFVTVKAGDTLAIIAKEFYGDSKEYKRIIKANNSIKSTSTPLHIGQKIHVPR